MIGYIYKHTSPSGKSYIGQTLGTLKRRWDSGHGYAPATIFGSAIKKYGWKNFEHVVLHIVEAEDSESLVNELNALEISEIVAHNSIHPDGYNGTLGGRNGFRTENQKSQISKTLTGRKISDEHRANISLALKRRWQDPVWQENFSEKMKAKYREEDYNKKRSASLSKALKGRTMSDEWKKRMSDAAKKRWENKRLENEQKAKPNYT